MKPAERSKLVLAAIVAGAIAVILLLFTYPHRPPDLRPARGAPQTQGPKPTPPPTPSAPSATPVPAPPLRTAGETKSFQALKKIVDELTHILILQKNLTLRVEREDQKREGAPLEKLLPGLEQDQSEALNQTNDLIQLCEKNKREAAALSRVVQSLKKMKPTLSDIDGELKKKHLEHSARWLDKIHIDLLKLLESIDLEEERLLPSTPNPYAFTHESLDVFERRRLREIPELPPEERRVFDLVDDSWKRTELIYLKERKIREALILAANTGQQDDKSRKFILSELSLKQSNLEKQTRSIQAAPPNIQKKTLATADSMNQAARLLWDFNPHEALKHQRQAMRSLEAILRDFDKIE